MGPALESLAGGASSGVEDDTFHSYWVVCRMFGLLKFRAHHHLARPRSHEAASGCVENDMWYGTPCRKHGGSPST